MKQTDLFTQKDQCYGCGACANVCPRQAIKMQADEEGFLYPSIDEAFCVDCQLCQKACQIHNQVTVDAYTPLVYAVQHKDNGIRAKSASGGVFPAMAKTVIERQGVVYGVAYTDDFYVQHERVEQIEECLKFSGSKYVQSDTNSTFKSVKQDLRLGRFVLYTGTACQIAGLRSYLGIESQNEHLLLCEILCHAAPSPLMWKEHLTFLEKTRRAKVIQYKNRSKVAGWHGHNEHVFFDNGKNEYKTKLSQNHKDLFYSHLTIRPSCYRCEYTGTPKQADITIADFWGIERCMPDFDDNKGTSLVLINSDRGEKFFNWIQDELVVRESNLTDAFADNHKHPAKKNVRRAEFWSDYQKYGYGYVVKKYAAYSTTGKVKRWVKFRLKDLSKAVGTYELIHKFTSRKYQKNTYK